MHEIAKTIFSARNNILQITAKNNYWGAWPFFREQGVEWQKWMQPFLWVMVYQILFWSFFLKKAHIAWMKAKKPVLRRIFPHISGFIGPMVSKNNRVHSWVDPHLPCEFNRFKNPTSIVRSYTYICNQGPPKQKMWQTPPPPSQVEGVRIVIISFWSIAK